MPTVVSVGFDWLLLPFPGVYVPIGGKQLINFMDDFNMPAKDTFGSQPPLELIRLWLDYGFWYDRAKQTVKYIKVCTPPPDQPTVSFRFCFGLLVYLSDVYRAVCPPLFVSPSVCSPSCLSDPLSFYPAVCFQQLPGCVEPVRRSCLHPPCRPTHPCLFHASVKP